MSVRAVGKVRNGTPVRKGVPTGVETMPVRYLDKAAFRAAKKRVFTKHAELLSKLAK